MKSAQEVVDQKQITLPITGMTCANCAATIQRTLEKKVAGVVGATVNFATEKARVEYDPAQVSRRDLVEAIEKIGYSVAESGRMGWKTENELPARLRFRTRLTSSGSVWPSPYLCFC